jgi:hypothetical protein
MVASIDYLVDDEILLEEDLHRRARPLGTGIRNGI